MSIDFHRRMLADAVRHAAFREALARVIVPGRTTVADIGAGTGILAFFARQLGAREVWLYEPGAVMELAEMLAARNGIDGLHFVPEHSLAVECPPPVDLVVAEVLGNFAYEEGVLDTLRDARRFLAQGGVLMPHSIVQFASPVVVDRFDRELASWRRVGFGLDYEDAEVLGRNNMYVYTVTPADLLPDGAREWDRVVFVDEFASRREGEVRWRVANDATWFGFALWWTCTLTPGVDLSTSPYAPPTHWEQIYLPLLTPLVVAAGDEVRLSIATETGGGIDGIAMTWTATHRARIGAERSQTLDIARGYLP